MKTRFYIVAKVIALLGIMSFSPALAAADSETELLMAAKENNINRMRAALRSGAWVNTRTYDGFTPLFAVVRNGNKAALKLLIDAKADVNASSVDGSNPLSEAVVLGKLDIARTLLKAGANPAQRGYQGMNSLHFAIRMSQHAILEPLLKAGGNPNDTDDDGISAFHLAVLQRDDAAVRLFIKYGANVNARGPRGRTPLMICYLSEKGSLRQRGIVLGLLIDARADLNLMDEDGYTLLDMSERGFELVMSDQLRKEGAKKGSEMVPPSESQLSPSNQKPAAAETEKTNPAAIDSTSEY